MKPKTRLDLRLVESGKFETRARAQAAILAGKVRVVSAKGAERSPVTAGLAVRDDDIVTVDAGEEWASRGAGKLDPILTEWKIDVAGRVCADIGASTGGFTDVLLRRGATIVYAVDVGAGQLLPRLAGDPRVRVRDRVNARDLSGVAFDAGDPEVVVVDVSFISVRRILAALRARIAEAHRDV